MNPIDSNAEWLEADGLGGFASERCLEYAPVAITRYC